MLANDTVSGRAMVTGTLRQVTRMFPHGAIRPRLQPNSD
jgi:hypothetical protein